MRLLSAISVSLVIDHDGRISYASPSSGDLYGRAVPIGAPVEDVLGSAWLAEQDRDEVLDVLASAGHWSGTTTHRGEHGPVEVAVEARLRSDQRASPSGLYLEVTPLDASQPGHEVADEARYRMSLDRLERLQAISARLVSVSSLRDIAEVVCGEAVDGVGAFAASLALVTPQGTHLQVVSSCGYPVGLVPRWRYLALTERAPAVEAARTGRPVWLESPDEQARRFPDLVQLLPDTESLCALPLRVDEVVLGTLWFSFARPRRFERDDKNFLLTVAGQCASALARVRQGSSLTAPGASEGQSVLMLETTDLHAVGLRARRLLSQVDTDGIDPRLRSELEVVTTELTTNAARHAGGALRLIIERRHDRFRVRVDDTCELTPVKRSPEESEGGGRGMLIVDALSRCWGVELQPWGKSVWAELG